MNNINPSIKHTTAQKSAAEFSNDGNSESDFIAHHADACTACGGSGHKADQRPAALDGAAVAIKSAIAELDALRNAMFKTYAAAANGADKTKLIRLIEAERYAYEAHYSLPKLQAALSAQPVGYDNDQ